MRTLQFRLAARTDAAGKYNPNAPLEGNEDNMFVDCYLDNDKQGGFMGDEVVELCDLGCLMVVADGMGGMNAGEVASDIAIKTVEKYFAPDKLKGITFTGHKSRINYMEKVVVAADAAIKADSKKNIDHEGMGSTLIMAWLCDGEICLTWCGDSRAYLFHPGKGLRQVSKDHSYVQGLVDKGEITMDEAFDHPYGNIITRSLGDPEKEAKPESKCFKVYQGDIFLLCSDGLSGVLRDHKTYKDGQRIDTENLEDIIAENRDSLSACRDKLFEAAQRNDWYDNVTAILCEIVKGDESPNQAEESENVSSVKNSHIVISKKKIPLIIALATIIVGVALFFAWRYFVSEEKRDKAYYDYCVQSSDVNTYRSYLRDFEKGKYRDLAESFVSKYVTDSINEANQSIETREENNNAPAKEDGMTKNTKKGEKNNNDSSDEKVKDTKSTSDDEFNDLTTLLTPSMPSDITISNPKSEKNENSVKEENTEEQEQIAYEKCIRRETTYEDCIQYLRKYKNLPQYTNHSDVVLQNFKSKYDKEIHRLKNKTVKECEAFKNKHKERMKDVGLEDTEYDNSRMEKIEKFIKINRK